jgi:hypothetical protein
VCARACEFDERRYEATVYTAVAHVIVHLDAAAAAATAPAPALAAAANWQRRKIGKH